MTDGEIILRLQQRMKTNDPDGFLKEIYGMIDRDADENIRISQEMLGLREQIAEQSEKIQYMHKELERVFNLAKSTRSENIELKKELDYMRVRAKDDEAEIKMLRSGLEYCADRPRVQPDTFSAKLIVCNDEVFKELGENMKAIRATPNSFLVTKETLDAIKKEMVGEDE